MVCWRVGRRKTLVLFVDGSSNLKGSGAGIVLESPYGIMVEQSFRFGFKASNNQVEYEALITGLQLAKEWEQLTLPYEAILSWSQVRYLSHK